MRSVHYGTFKCRPRDRWIGRRRRSERLDPQDALAATRHPKFKSAGPLAADGKRIRGANRSGFSNSTGSIWGIDSLNHRSRDTAFGEDGSFVRKGNASVSRAAAAGSRDLLQCGRLPKNFFMRWGS